jgi:hypothetical protein
MLAVPACGGNSIDDASASAEGSDPTTDATGSAVSGASGDDTSAGTGAGTAGASSSTPGAGDPEDGGGPGGSLDPSAGTETRFGLAVSGADPAALAAIEERAGARVGIVRVFARWDTSFPNANHRALLDDGRLLHLSVRPRTDGGTVIPWADIAAAEPGSAVHTQMERWAGAVADHGSQIVFTLNHEPETAASEANGTAADFVAAWRSMVTLLRDQPGGAEVRTVLVLGRSAYADGSIDEWYPGDDVVDVIGVDLYNWYDCQGTTRPWTEPRILVLPAVEFAAAHDKALAMPEIASTEDPNRAGRKAEWIRQLGDYVASGSVDVPIEFLAWFSVHDRSWPDCLWEHDSSPSAETAISELITSFAPETDG